jgi:prevent-host-death family protein
MKRFQDKKGRVLLVDAEQAESKQYRRPLLKAGFDVAEARTGMSALEKLEAEQFDVVVMDLKMPDVSGVDLFRSLRQHSPQARVIVMVGAAERDSTLRGTEGEAVKCLVKPITPRTLEREVSYAIRARRPVPTFRNYRGEPCEPSLLSATSAKNEFGKVLDIVMRGGAVAVTKHDDPKAVIISLDDFKALSTGVARELNSLASDFDAMLDHMQTREARAGMKRAFDASPEELGKAAVRAARKRA